MGTIIKLLIAAVIINAAVRSGSVALDYYQLKDAAQQIVLFAGDSSNEELRGEILRKATDLDVPLAATAIDVRRGGSLTAATATYTQHVELFPRFKYPITLSFKVDARSYDASAVPSTTP